MYIESNSCFQTLKKCISNLVIVICGACPVSRHCVDASLFAEEKGIRLHSTDDWSKRSWEGKWLALGCSVWIHTQPCLILEFQLVIIDGVLWGLVTHIWTLKNCDFFGVGSVTNDILDLLDGSPGARVMSWAYFSKACGRWWFWARQMAFSRIL